MNLTGSRNGNDPATNPDTSTNQRNCNESWQKLLHIMYADQLLLVMSFEVIEFRQLAIKIIPLYFLRQLTEFTGRNYFS